MDWNHVVLWQIQKPEVRGTSVDPDTWSLRISSVIPAVTSAEPRSLSQSPRGTTPRHSDQVNFLVRKIPAYLSPREEACRSALQSQKAVTAYLKSKQSLPFGFALRSYESKTMCAGDGGYRDGSGDGNLDCLERRVWWTGTRKQESYTDTEGGGGGGWSNDGGVVDCWGKSLRGRVWLHPSIYTRPRIY